MKTVDAIPDSLTTALLEARKPRRFIVPGRRSQPPGGAAAPPDPASGRPERTERAFNPYPKRTATHKACEMLAAGSLPQTRTHGGAPETRAWRSKRAWWAPPGSAR